jgi:xylulokinase
MYLGLDVGTSGVKATVIDDNGNIRMMAARKYPLYGLENNYRELDSNQVWDSTKSAISEVIGQIGPSEIEYITVISLGEAIIPVDKLGQPLMRSIIGSDIRGGEELAWLCQRIEPSELTQITGLNLSTIYSINKILYIRNHFPEVYADTWKFYCFTDFIVYKLTGESVIDYSMASRMLAFDINSYEWSNRILKEASIDPDVFSRPVVTGEIAGQVLDSIAVEIGLSSKIKVLIGPHDHICNALGAGVVKKGDCSNIVGTTEGITAILGKEKLSVTDISVNNISCEPFVLPGTFNTVAWHNTAGALINWFLDVFFGKIRSASQTVEILSVLNQTYSGKPTKLMIQPHFSGSTTKFMDDKAKGTILGLSLSTTREEIFQALLEGASYECMLIVGSLENAGLPVNDLIVSGGGSKSDAWLSIKADMFGKPVHTVECADTGALGGGMLAAVTSKKYNSFEEAAKIMVKKGKTIFPNEENTKIYQERFEMYKELYQKTKGISHILH